MAEYGANDTQVMQTIGMFKADVDCIDFLKNIDKAPLMWSEVDQQQAPTLVNALLM